MVRYFVGLAAKSASLCKYYALFCRVFVSWRHFGWSSSGENVKDFFVTGNLNA